MSRFRVLLLLLTLLPLAGCTSGQLRGSLYEGLRTRNDLQSSPADRLGRPDSPDYAEYERQRQERNR